MNKQKPFKIVAFIDTAKVKEAVEKTDIVSVLWIELIFCQLLYSYARNTHNNRVGIVSKTKKKMFFFQLLIKFSLFIFHPDIECVGNLNSGKIGSNGLSV